jgi:hypothetical protein
MPAALVHGTFIFYGRDVAGIPVLNNGLEHATHDLAAARLGNHIDKVQFADHGHRA